MIQFDPSNVPRFDAAFFRRQVAMAPPGHRPHTIYLGKRQMSEMATHCNGNFAPTVTTPFTYQSVNFFPVDAQSHFLMTFVTYEPTRDELIGELVNYCLTLPTHQDCPPEFLDLIVRADRVSKAPLPTP